MLSWKDAFLKCTNTELIIGQRIKEKRHNRGAGMGWWQQSKLRDWLKFGMLTEQWGLNYELMLYTDSKLYPWSIYHVGSVYRKQQGACII